MKQKGFTLVELIVTISISALLAIYAQSQLARAAEEQLATASASYMTTVANAAQQMILVNFNNYSNSTPVAGVATLLRPTSTELKAMGYLPISFPITPVPLPTQQGIRVDVLQSSCPGSTCTLQILVCTTSAVTLGGPTTRFDLASTMVSAQGGKGGQSLVGNGAQIIGPGINVANPIGNLEGIACATAAVDTALFQRFVTIGDSRDPGLTGDLSVAGKLTITGTSGPSTINNNLTVNGGQTVNGGATINGGATVNGALTNGPCIKLDGTNAATLIGKFDCGGGSAPAGYTGVLSTDVVSNRNILASDNPAAFSGANTNYAMVTSNNGAGAAEIRTSGRAAADRLVPNGTYAAGAGCSDDGAIARRGVGTGLVVCQSGTWRNLMVNAATGDACSVEGASANSSTGVLMMCMNGRYVDMNSMIQPATAGTPCATSGSFAVDTSAGNSALICRANPGPGGGGLRWMRLQDITSNLSFVNSVEVTDGAVIAKPSCTPAAGMTSLPVLQLIPKALSTSDGSFSFYADGGAQWTVHMKNASGVALSGPPYAVAQIFCYYQ